MTVSKSERGLSRWFSSKESVCNAGDAGDLGSIPGSGRSLGAENGNPVPYSCLGNPIDRGAWQATVHGVAKSQTQLSTQVWKHVLERKSLFPARCLELSRYWALSLLWLAGRTRGMMLCLPWGRPPWTSSPHNSELLIILSLWCSLFFYLKNFPYINFPSETMYFMSSVTLRL